MKLKKNTLNFIFQLNKSVDFSASWDEVDLGMLLTLYLFQNNDLTQAKIAEDLGVTPMAISRRIKTKGSKIPEKWYENFSEYICDIDIEDIQLQLEVLRSMQSQIIAMQAFQLLVMIIQRYLESKKEADHFMFRETPRSMGQVVFEDTTTSERWVFFPFPTDLTLNNCQDIVEVFENRATSYKNGHPVSTGKQSIVFNNEIVFEKACILWKESNLEQAIENTLCQRSLMLMNLDEQAIVREFICE